MKTTKYYFAYGMNANMQQMAYRCPNAEAIGKVTLRGYKFVFRGVADAYYTGNPLDTIEGCVWEITDECEYALDLLEGYPTFYTKASEWVLINNQDQELMLYTMTKKSQGKYADPSKHYWEMLWQGYEQFGINHRQMFEGLPAISKYRKLNKSQLTFNNN